MQLNVPCISLSREVLGMVTLGNLMSKMLANLLSPLSPVSKVLYTQFKKVYIYLFKGI